MVLGSVLSCIIDQIQAAFMLGKNTHDHILKAYELIRGHSRKEGAPIKVMQMDVQKSYDSMDWNALETIFKEINFPRMFTNWITLLVTIVSYRFTINGEHTKIMKANRGLRQGDRMSLLLFVIVMEYMHKILHKLKYIPNFIFQSKCEKLHIINISFVDDLLLFARGDSTSVKLLMKAFNDFSKSKSLIVNPAKCKVYYGGVEDTTKKEIYVITSFDEGPIPFWYLGDSLT
ncbi:unnamed protein product [Lathyrus oleraceus]